MMKTDLVLTFMVFTAQQGDWKQQQRAEEMEMNTMGLL